MEKNLPDDCFGNLLLGDGIFTTFAVIEHTPLFLKYHWERLQKNAAASSLDCPTWDTYKAEVSLFIEKLPPEKTRVKAILLRHGDGIKSHLFFQSSPLPHKKQSPAHLFLTEKPRNEKSYLSGVKSLSYAENLQALRHAQQQGADEALFLNTQGHVCEGTRSNLFLLSGKTLYTPALTAGCLDGVMRKITLELCASHSIACKESLFPPSFLEAADEIFLTSSLQGITPARKITTPDFSQKFPKIGKTTHFLQQQLEEKIRQEHSA